MKFYILHSVTLHQLLFTQNTNAPAAPDHFTVCGFQFVESKFGLKHGILHFGCFVTFQNLNLRKIRLLLPPYNFTVYGFQV